MNPKDKDTSLTGSNIGKDRTNLTGSNITGSSTNLGSSTTSSTGSSLSSPGVGTGRTGTAAAPARVIDDSRTTEQSESKYSDVVNKVTEKVSEVASNITNNVNLDTIRDKADSVISYSKENVGKSVLVGVGVGLLVGYLLAPRRPNYAENLNCIVKDSLNLLLDRIL
jgi:ElaB/YqjD/DUF883 family membrane-anchored ribosome-binding protein